LAGAAMAWMENMDLEKELANAKARSAQSAAEGFEQWLQDPRTSALLSVLPDTGHRDFLNVLLRSAFQAGHAAGESNMVHQMLEKFMAKRRAK
jgi:hypothetical protein